MWRKKRNKICKQKNQEFHDLIIYIYKIQNSVFAERYVLEKLLRCGGGKELKDELWREYIIQSTARKRLKRNKESKDPKLCLPPLWWGDILFLSCPSVCPSQFVSATPLKLLNRISWNLVGSKDTICSCAYYQEILIAWILWELCPFELKNFPKFTTEAACQRNSSKTTEQNFMKLGR
jgi:hypothetical protein